MLLLAVGNKVQYLFVCVGGGSLSKLFVHVGRDASDRAMVASGCRKVVLSYLYRDEQ